MLREVQANEIEQLREPPLQAIEAVEQPTAEQVVERQ